MTVRTKDLWIAQSCITAMSLSLQLLFCPVRIMHRRCLLFIIKHNFLFICGSTTILRVHSLAYYKAGHFLHICQDTKRFVFYLYSSRHQHRTVNFQSQCDYKKKTNKKTAQLVTAIVEVQKETEPFLTVMAQFLFSILLWINCKKTFISELKPMTSMVIDQWSVRHTQNLWKPTYNVPQLSSFPHYLLAFLESNCNFLCQTDISVCCDSPMVYFIF